MLRARTLAPLLLFGALACSGDERPTAPDTCPYALDGECDEPDFCLEGTDTTDCGDDSCEYANDGECDEPTYCLYGSDTTDCRAARLCEPQCGARVCGRDPVCNKSCGTCPAEFSCNVDGQCVDNRCQPDCSGRVCGPDPVCGMSCGECSGETFACTSEGACVDTSCQPQCGERECGPDPVCNQDCGTCEAGESCNAQGRCQPPCSFPRITSDTELVRDVQVVSVSGQVTFNGGLMPDDGVLDGDERGRIVFTDERTGSSVSAEVGETGPATYQVLLFAGTYTVRFAAEPAFDQDVLPPGQSTLLAEGVQISTSGAIDYDLTVVTVSGQVTVNGGTMPDDTILDGDERARIVFRDTQTGSSVSTPLGETGPATFQTLLFGGAFDVDVVGEPAFDQDALPPAQRVQVAEGTQIGTSGNLSFDLTVIDVSGAVTVNGQVMPDDTILDGDERGRVRFELESTGSVVSVPVGETGAGVYSARLFAGRYLVEFEAEPAFDQAVLPPNGRTLLESGLDLNASGSLGFDLPVITISGQVTMNGGVMPDDAILDGDERGRVVFEDRATGQPTSVEFGETGPATYQALLFAGRYDVRVSTEPGFDQDVLPPAVATEVGSDVSLTTSGSLDFDVSVVTVSGAVTLNGVAMSDDPVLDGDERGRLLFIEERSGQTVSAPLGETGPATYQALLFAGTYEVRLRAEPAWDQGVLPPSQATRLARGQSITTSGSLSYDVRTHRLFGQITVDGRPMPDDTILDGDDRAELRLVDKDTGSSSARPLGETGPATFDVRVFEGSYDVFLSAEPAFDQAVLPPGQELQLEVGCP